MALSIGIVGLPNVGKSTLFNALTKQQHAEAANYPFCTIEPNKAVVAVPDDRVDNLVTLVGADRAIKAQIEFTDIAGLVAGASKGEGLGNKFLGNIRDVDAILHVVRCFDDENVVHVSAKPDPQSDIEVINTELALSDLEQVERKLEKLERQIKGEPKLKPIQAMALKIKDFLETGEPLWKFPERDQEAFHTLNHELRLLTAKPILYAANVDEDSIATGNTYVEQARQIAADHGTEIIVVCAKLEGEMAGMDDDERREFLETYEVEESGLEQIIRKSYDLLGLISYFTFNDEEVHVWTIKNGWNAPQAAGAIHTDFERGFIRAEVVTYDDFARYGDRNAVKDAGLMRVEGKDYIVNDGDMLVFRFNV